MTTQKIKKEQPKCDSQEYFLFLAEGANKPKRLKCFHQVCILCKDKNKVAPGNILQIFEDGGVFAAWSCSKCDWFYMGRLRGIKAVKKVDQ